MILHMKQFNLNFVFKVLLKVKMQMKKKVSTACRVIFSLQL